MLKKIFIYFLLLSLPLFLFSQKRPPNLPPPDKEEAKDNFENANYKAALAEYLGLIKTAPKNAMYNYRIGYCYIYTNIDKAKAISYLKVAATYPEFEKEALFELGKAFAYSYDFDSAIVTMEKFKAVNKSSEKLDEADHIIENCTNAKELIKFPQQLKFENLGKDVNSEYDDYYPFVTGDEILLVYNSRRKGNTGSFQLPDGGYTADVFMAQEKAANSVKEKLLEKNSILKEMMK